MVVVVFFSLPFIAWQAYENAACASVPLECASTFRIEHCRRRVNCNFELTRPPPGLLLPCYYSGGSRLSATTYTKNRSPTTFIIAIIEQVHTSSQ